MNALKNLFIVAALAAVAYGVYASLNRNPAAPPAPAPVAPPGGAPEWTPPTVQLPGPTVPGAPGSGGPGSRADGGLIPSIGSVSSSGAAGRTAPPAGVGGEAPPYVPPTAPASSSGLSGGTAPPYVPPRDSRAASASEMAPPFSAGASAGPGTSAPPLGPASGSSSVPAFPSAAPATSRAAPGPLAPQRASREKVEAVMKATRAKLDEGQPAEAHRILSSIYDSLYDNPSVPPDMFRHVIQTLDRMAAEVIYSRRHLLEPAYRVQPGDTLQRIAQNYRVPAQLLARINGIRQSPEQELPPGRELKVIRGPFRALVDAQRLELTLMLGERYAGRFPIGAGADLARLSGSYAVRDKKVNSATGGYAAGDTANNFAGRFWIDLGSQLAIRGALDPRDVGRIDPSGGGAICLGDRDLDDVFGILSVGSQVVIRR